MLPACPLMHGTGQFSSLVTHEPGRHDRDAAVAPLRRRRAVARGRAGTKVNAIVIVGQAFAGPMLTRLDEQPGPATTCRACILITSSGVMWSQENKDGLLRHLPQAILFDSFGSSEAVGLGGSISTKRRRRGDGQVRRSARTCGVFTEDGQRVEPGSAEPGLRGRHRATSRSATTRTRPRRPHTFRTFEGRRWSVPGDWAEVERRRDAAPARAAARCASTPAARRCSPRRSRRCSRRTPACVDAVCVGVPDARFGEVITAVVEVARRQPRLDRGRARPLTCRPRWPPTRRRATSCVVDTIGRAPNGKVDYKRLKALATERVSAG